MNLKLTNMIIILTADTNCLCTNVRYIVKSEKVCKSVNPLDAGSNCSFFLISMYHIYLFISSHFRGLQINFAYKSPTQKPTVQCPARVRKKACKVKF